MRVLAVGDCVVPLADPAAHGWVRGFDDAGVHVQWAGTFGTARVPLAALRHIEDWPERIALIPDTLPIDWFYVQAAGNVAWACGAGRFGAAPPVEGVDCKVVTDTDGVRHVALTVPWPGRDGYLIAFRGTLCPRCDQPRIDPHPPWVCPVVRCACPVAGPGAGG